MSHMTLTATVPREFVHRAAVAETFLTGWRQTGPDQFTLFGQWPRAHQLHVSPDRSAYEPLLVAETVRQCGALLAHAEYDAPLDHCFVLQELQFTTHPEHLAVGAVPAEPTLDVTVVDVRRRAGRPIAFAYDTAVRIGGERVATAHLAVSWTSESVYRRLRGGRTPENISALPLPPGLPATEVGRTLPADVVLAQPERPDRWQLRVDTAHPVFFDHPLDHIPGMLLLEAARQAARVRAADPGSGASFHATFHKYAELDRPVWIEATDGKGSDLQLVGRQGESTVFECAVDAAAR
ncbi:ScbA/BarX family gamma-butyrolactone biosynthesis protein [Streptomyces sp. NPDC001663]|uniref:ScbA/BarX family gamma-butyrolactone biosynthesis protein n=1 Tax=Streptomyces sp. NPDC001663 TaxID=3364597 RepID=UPI003682A32C